MFKSPRFNAPVNSESKINSGDASTVSSRLSKTAPESGRPRVRRGAAVLVIFVLLGSMATGFVGGYLGSSAYGNASTGSLTSPDISRQRQEKAQESQLIAAIAEDVGPSVVSINITTSGGTTSDVFGFSVPSRPQTAAGTGIIISSEGVIVTNRHVVPTGLSDINVTLSDGTLLEDVTVIDRTNPNDSLDIAFLKINDTEGNRLTPAVIGDSGNVEVGDTVVAIGNALGQFNNTVTSGIISGYGRSVTASEDGTAATAESLNDLFQTDAAINQGNSGGPLVNMDGQVIGINTAVAGEGQNIGFAIPINDVSGLIKQVLDSGNFERPYLGVRYIELTADRAEQYELDIEQGAFVVPSPDATASSVLPDSPASKAGIREGDVITAVDGTKLGQGRSLTSLIGRKGVGDEVRLTVLRDGKTITLNAELGALPNTSR